MAITAEKVREILKGLESGDGSTFFGHVAEDVDWTVMGTHPIAGHYLSKNAFIEGTFAKLAKVLPQGAELHTEHVIVQNDQGTKSMNVPMNTYLKERSRNKQLWKGISCRH